eukprot:TRINITY_DN8054_c0_g7_i1.p1 TRINITY_DN8054_c0_g7~~TRINITY_DN8054_c0_g7_i1.p1  ORF type:complete len:391 (-),score=102.66 TRINITY_DN8054_c0_g7_i1:58-1230(-)
MSAPGLEGYLSKQGGGNSVFGRKSWKVRYFVLSKGLLSYYTDRKAYKEKEEALGAIHVLQITSIKTKSDPDKKFSGQHHREIILPNRTLTVCCDSEAILQKWIDAVNSHIRAERGAGQQDVEQEIALVEMEARRQITFNILLNVLKRWVTVDWARTVASWRANLEIDLATSPHVRGVLAEGEEADVEALKERLVLEHDEEMARLSDELRNKWKAAVDRLKAETLNLKQENTRLTKENKALRESADSKSGTKPKSPRPETPREDTVMVLREEFVSLMEAAMHNTVDEEAKSAHHEHQLTEIREELARTKRELALSSQRCSHLEAQLKSKAQHSVMNANNQNNTGSPPALQETLAQRATSPARRPSPPQPQSSPRETSSWISRYRAIVGADF